ncbi:head-tail connector protein [Phaeovulum sp.]|uniref:head-tail connector protein n=1 Tax=Phaeovulum sp. TaxID=2934796 RepID=UPI0039E67229
MMLIEETVVPAAALPVAEFRDHMRLGTGFADLGAEDAALEAYLRAAMAAIEGRTAKVLLARDYLLTLEAWRGEAQPLPVAPVSAVSLIRVRDQAGVAAVVSPARYRLVRDLGRPRITAVGMLPGIPTGGVVEIAFTAGFGPAWSDLPADLAQAVFLLAAQYYELRHEGARGGDAMPFGVMALIERWRTVRVLGGRPSAGGLV